MNAFRYTGVALVAATLGLVTPAWAQFRDDFDIMVDLVEVQSFMGGGRVGLDQIHRARGAYELASPGATVYYPNGQVLTHSARRSGATLYYPNGQTATHSSQREGATWYYPNGQTATHSIHRTGATWYYPSGRTATHSAGRRGATWYYPGGQVVSHSMGQRGATWYYATGQVMTHSGPAVYESELADVPGFMIRIMRLNGR